MTAIYPSFSHLHPASMERSLLLLFRVSRSHLSSRSAARLSLLPSRFTLDLPPPLHTATYATMSSPPSSVKAITIASPKKAEITTVPLPKLRDDYILVRTTAVGLNPTDWKSIDGLAGPNVAGCRVGCDYAGIVEEVGSGVTKPFNKGDRICGVAHGVNQGVDEDGAFAEYIVVKGDIAIKIPDNLSDEQAAGLGIGITTVGQGLYQALGLPLPTSPSSTPTPILINGGSTATGMLGIQFAKLSGYRVLATCSPRNAEYLRSLGADDIIDYREYSDPEKFAAKVHEILGGDNLGLVWDCIGLPESAKLVVPAISKTGGKYRSLLTVPDEIVHGINDKVDSSWTFAYFVFGEKFTKGRGTFEARPEDMKFGQMFWDLSRDLLESGKLKVPRQEVNRGGKGLEGVLKGLDELRQDKVSGVKLIYTL